MNWSGREVINIVDQVGAFQKEDARKGHPLFEMNLFYYWNYGRKWSAILHLALILELLRVEPVVMTSLP